MSWRVEISDVCIGVKPGNKLTRLNRPISVPIAHASLSMYRAAHWPRLRAYGLREMSCGGVDAAGFGRAGALPRRA